MEPGADFLAFCSTPCRTHFNLRASPAAMRQHVFFRDAGTCRACGHQHQYLNGEWDADHVRPLHASFGDPAFWEPDNVVILCRSPCHKQKTEADKSIFPTHSSKTSVKVRKS